MLDITCYILSMRCCILCIIYYVLDIFYIYIYIIFYYTIFCNIILYYTVTYTYVYIVFNSKHYMLYMAYLRLYTYGVQAAVLQGASGSQATCSTVDSRKFLHICKMIHAGFASFLGLGVGRRSCSNLLALADSTVKGLRRSM